MRRVRWVEQAQADLVRITDYYAAAAPDFTESLLDRIEALAGLLASYPEIGAALSGTGVRKVSVRGTRYLLFYRVTPDAIEILRVYHARQDWRGE